MARADPVVQGREAFSRRRWRVAHAKLSVADRRSPLEPDDLERLATAAYLIGEDSEAAALWMRVHHACIDRGELERAARWGFWLSLDLLLDGEPAKSAGWLARSRRLLEDRKTECVEQGYGLIVGGLLAIGGGDVARAGASFERAVALAERFGDADLLALGLLGQGQCMILSGHIAEGVARLDEAMVAVTAGDLTPIFAGIVYCAVILACQHIFDLRRAQEWTGAMTAWCAAQPEIVPFRGQCLVHRSEVLQQRGDWVGAMREVEHACAQLAGRSEAVVGRAYYQRGELHRLRGEFDLAERMYREAGRNGCEPQPGVALLRLAQGERDAAAAALRGVVISAGGSSGAKAGLSRTRLLGPFVEILLAIGDLAAAREAADELAAIAEEINAPFLIATAAQARGAVQVAEGEPSAALGLLRKAWAVWQELGMPYESARVQALMARACLELGDRETARLHVDGARATFRRLGAAPDLVALERALASDGAGPAGALTEREREVLELVAAGETNRQIADQLAISEHTVARHLSNIFNKLGVSSRTAASAFAHKHRLV